MEITWSRRSSPPVASEVALLQSNVVSGYSSENERHPLNEGLSYLKETEIPLLGEDFDDLQSALSVSTISNDGKVKSCDELSTIFDDDALLEAAQAQEETSDRSTLSKAAKLDKIAPRVPKNDIRRFFANMFMNTVNSADFHRTEDFFRTFMTPQCTFVSQQQLSQEFHVPSALYTVGARQFAHYLLGCFVMYPDMVLSMTDVKMITSNAWAGTKIVMNVEYHLTKTHDIPVECWVPPTPSLDLVYKETSLEGMMAAVRLTAVEESEKETIDFSAPNTTYGAKNSTNSASTNTTSTGTVTAAVKKVRKRRRRSDIEAAAKAYIPEKYIGVLQTNAVRLEQPRGLLVKGEFALFLDEKHQIQHAVLKGQQLSV